MADSSKQEKGISIAINEVQLVLAEKRTSLAVMRTGIAVLVLPISVLSVLIALSRYYNVSSAMPFIVPLGVLLLFLFLLGLYLVIHSIYRMRRYDQIIRQIKQRHGVIADVIE
ncbi:MAG: hypothetical protein B5M56_06490 [Desulfococcus sp. 4484_241]|nr:MAG: hypothetical protein B5M56_06490 [Desulfococcus sp. 4484_241]RLC28877.1 MAG: hypothetical protein DRH32_08310 [Deltaproteobacteria bacterium]